MCKSPQVHQKNSIISRAYGAPHLDEKLTFKVKYTIFHVPGTIVFEISLVQRRRRFFWVFVVLIFVYLAARGLHENQYCFQIIHFRENVSFLCNTPPPDLPQKGKIASKRPLYFSIYCRRTRIVPFCTSEWRLWNKLGEYRHIFLNSWIPSWPWTTISKFTLSVKIWSTGKQRALTQSRF